MTRELTLDATGLAAGLSEKDLAGLEAPARAALDQTIALRSRRTVGFLDLPDDRAAAKAAMDFARGIDPQIDTMVVLGIGGSSLGPRALYSALAPPWDSLRPRSPGMPRRLFFPDNVDPQTFAALLDLLPLDRTLWNVVTKSGGTAETAAQLLVVADRLARALGPARARHHIVATTDPDKGILRKTAIARGWRTFDLPPSVGGRFSVLSPVGLLPAAVAGLDVSGLLDGARRMRDRALAPSLRENPALLLASLLHHHHAAHGRAITVMMSYVDALHDTADWFRQLWGESLGQRSQLELHAEGPDDKTYMFVTAKERGRELAIPRSELAESTPDYAYLAGRGLGELLDAEMAGTIGALRRRSRPTATVTLARPSAGALGELIMLLEAATAFAGPLYGVDPYDQPGVEDAERRAYAALGRPGFEALAKEIAAAPGPDPRWML